MKSTHNAKAEYTHNGITYTLVNFLSGVLQGCPASAFLFNNALDPFLTRFHNTFRPNNAGIVRACADDIGISIVRLKHLLLIASVFKDCRIFAGLELKPIKCVLVPLCMFPHKVHDSIKKWLRKNIPEWAEFKVAPFFQIAWILSGAPSWIQDVGGTHEKIQ